MPSSSSARKRASALFVRHVELVAVPPTPHAARFICERPLGRESLSKKGLGKEEAPEPFHAHGHPHLSGVTIAEKPPHNCIKFSRVNEWLFQSEESAVYT